MKQFTAYVKTKDGYIAVQAQVDPAIPAVMIYRRGPRDWSAGDISIGMSYQSKSYSSAAKAWEDIKSSDTIARAARIKKQFWLKSFKQYHDDIIQKCIDENNSTLYNYLTELDKEADNV